MNLFIYESDLPALIHENKTSADFMMCASVRYSHVLFLWKQNCSNPFKCSDKVLWLTQRIH